MLKHLKRKIASNKLTGCPGHRRPLQTSPTRASSAPNTSHAQPAAAQSGSVSSRKSGKAPIAVASDAAGHNASSKMSVPAVGTRPAGASDAGAMTEPEPLARNGGKKSMQDAVDASESSAHLNDLVENGSDGEGDDSGELDGADRDASIRPLTPSTIDAASSFTGSRSTSLHSLAPTSRTFKSFVTGHSKTSASTKPTTLMTSQQTSPPASQYQQQQQQGVAQESSQTAAKSVADIAQSEGLGLADMHAASSNRLATSVHEAEGVAQPVSHLSGPSGSNLTQPDSLPAPARPAQLAKASPLRNSFLGAAPTSSASSAHSTPTEEAAPPAHVRGLSSSNSITFSSLPSPSHRLASPTQAGDAEEMDIDSGNVESNTHYPSHHVPDPRNNPRASSPPPDNASTLTLASSTAPSLRGTANGSIRQAAVPSILGVSRDGRRHSGGNYAANEDASIRAIAPSRRESTDSIGSKWSAAVLSNRDKATDRENSFHTGRETSAGETGSYARKTPSMHTVNTTASSYYFAAPVSQPV